MDTDDQAPWRIHAILAVAPDLYGNCRGMRRWRRKRRLDRADQLQSGWNDQPRWQCDEPRQSRRPGLQSGVRYRAGRYHSDLAMANLNYMLGRIRWLLHVSHAQRDVRRWQQHRVADSVNRNIHAHVQRARDVQVPLCSPRNRDVWTGDRT